ncbi:CBS domain-containing protein [Haloquadratum walsbyi]|jgi:Zn-dependent proteases|uniref:Zinc metalloprotease n=1 Tax=Haloquadratum walsbyi J07HQW2 TaxID=1238425 RepID=U1NEU8_9EURY|nr:CBS domain-containing protein [Haloquadratum walsbyi]ERG95293.1 MAG: Zn-dependent protease [Haloquadratum walsbyi J07HQW2]
MRGIRIGSAFGIPIKLDITFLLILPLFAWLIGNDIAQLTGIVNDVFGSTISADPLTTGLTQWILGTATAIGLFICVLLHEFGHSLVAMYYGYTIDSITLWLFGGVASFTEMPERWQQSLIIAIAGPIVSVGVGIISYIGFIILPLTASLEPAKFVIGYLALTNVMLAVFNMLPGFPLDGGRVLRALLARTRSHARATQIAAEVGKVFAFLLGIVGLFANLFLVALAFFIYIGASSEAQQTVMKAAFDGVTVSDIMTEQSDLDIVDQNVSVATLLERMFTERHTGYPVVDNGVLIGVVTLDDARSVDEVEREAYRVDDVMTPDVTTIDPSADAMDAMQRMQENDIGRLPVIEDDELVGLISRSDLMTAFTIIKSRGSKTALTERDSTSFPSPR